MAQPKTLVLKRHTAPEEPQDQRELLQQAFSSHLVGLQSVAASLSSPMAFHTARASIDQPAVAGVAAQPGATAGSHTVSVKTLASAQKVLSSAFSDPSAPLKIVGAFLLNGRSIFVSASDTLSGLVAKINAVSAEAQASIVSDAPGEYRLCLASKTSGSLNAISTSDTGSDTVLASLGFLPDTPFPYFLRQCVTDGAGNTGAASIALLSALQPVGAAMSIPSGQAASGEVTIKGHAVVIDLNAMSLTDIANAIIAAGIPGVQAHIAGIPDASGNVSLSSPKQLHIVGTDGQPLNAAAFMDSGNVLSALGILQSGFANQRSSASDAVFTIDGIDYTRTSNSVNDVVQGVSIDLLSASDTPANITVSHNTEWVTSAIRQFADAYNGLVDGIDRQVAAFQKGFVAGAEEDQDTSPLFGSFMLKTIQSQVSEMLSASSGGKTLVDCGLQPDAHGKIHVDQDRLQQALLEDARQVAGLFGLSGGGQGESLAYIAASAKTRASSSAGYGVHIKRLACQAVVKAQSPFRTLGSEEILTFSGGIFGPTSIFVTLPRGATLPDAVELINSDSAAGRHVIAAQSDDGYLFLSSRGFGADQRFSISASAGGDSGFGAEHLSGEGQDVEGMINGELAVGKGQVLIGKSGNKTTDGLQVLYTGSATGHVGFVTVGHGIADRVNVLITTIAASQLGSVVGEESSVSWQIGDVQHQIGDMQSEIGSYESYLHDMYHVVDDNIVQLKSQQKTMNSRIGRPQPVSGGR